MTLKKWDQLQGKYTKCLKPGQSINRNHSKAWTKFRWTPIANTPDPKIRFTHK